MSGQDAHQRPAGEAIPLGPIQQYAQVGTELFLDAGQLGLEGRLKDRPFLVADRRPRLPPRCTTETRRPARCRQRVGLQPGLLHVVAGPRAGAARACGDATRSHLDRPVPRLARAVVLRQARR